MSAPGTQPSGAPAYHGAANDSVSVTVKDVAPPAAPAPGGHAPAPPAAKALPPPVAVPHKWTRFGLLVAALVSALATIIAQGVLMSHAIKYTYVFFADYSVKGSRVAKAPGLVIATAVLALLLGGTLLALLFFPIARFMAKSSAAARASANLGTSVTEVALVAILVVLWLASMGVAAKTADVLSGDGWPKAWVGGSAAALAFAIISLLLWIAILVFGVMTLLGTVREWKAHRPAPAATAAPQQHPAAYAAPQQPAAYAAPQQPAAYAAPQQPTAYTTPQPPAAYAAPQEPADDAQQQPAAYAPQQSHPVTYEAPQPQPTAYEAPQPQPAADAAQHPVTYATTTHHAAAPVSYHSSATDTHVAHGNY